MPWKLKYEFLVWRTIVLYPWKANKRNLLLSKKTKKRGVKMEGEREREQRKVQTTKENKK